MIPLRCRALLLLGLGLASCDRARSRVVLPPEGLAIDDSAQGRRRVFVERDWLTLFSRGSEDGRDTTLIAPYLLGTAGRLILVVDADQYITAFDESGSVRWQAGRKGSGPLEFRSIRDFEYDGANTILVHDPDVRKLTAIDTLGALQRASLLPRLPHSDQLVRVSQNRYGLFGENGDKDLLFIDSAGQQQGEDSIPWQAYGQLDRLARQLTATRDVGLTDHWAATLRLGNAWLAFDGMRPASGRRYYVEPTPFPAVVQTSTRTERSSRLLTRSFSALSSALAGDTLFVLFEGATKDARRLIDLYSWSSGNYLGSWLLPTGADEIALTPRLLVTLSNDPYPQLVAYQR